MLTQCPNPKCKFVFEVSDERGGKNGPCPQCGQVITFRSLEIVRAIERQHEALRERTQRSADPGMPRFSAVLEDIRSLWNVGSMFRSADGAGFQKLYLCGITGCPPNKAIAKTSLGAEDHIAWEHCNHALEVLPGLSAAGVQIVVLEKTDTSLLLSDALASGMIRAPLCLVVGNEVAGVCAETLATAATVCHLPMYGVKTSLNVAVAFGIAAYQIRQAVTS
ncbi:MAG TPA: TrmH family RNA methyltransferase [Planctomycetota bacterium]|nr:TrmH family RNA methyltransferase [Planctomycetota bacterium]